MATQLSQADLHSILDFIVGVAREAGELILEGSDAIRTSSAVDEKKNSVDLVTEYDVRVEELVKGKLSAEYPTFKFIGEESFAAGSRPEMTDEPTFCVDPIDGTTNFVHGFPHSCVSIGLISFKRPILGVIYNPFLDQLYTGYKNGGSYLTLRGRPAVRLPLANPPRPLPNLSQALLGIEWGSDRSLELVNKKGESFKRLAGDPKTGVDRGKMAHSLRSLGSAALNYCMVAQGALDIYWEIGTWPWDICAGAIIAQEAGGLVAGSRTDPLDNDVNEEIMWNRKHIVIRAIGDSEGETCVETQKRLIKEYYETVEDFEPK
ncbi:myo inositol monophosphatase [Fomes fomentarius]|nr:myo inositol monophosphatase [Fomes fomentarius]